MSLPINPSSMVQATDGAEDVVGGTEKNNTFQSSSTGEAWSEKKEPSLQTSDVESAETESVNANMETVALKALHVDDDPTLNPWTFRVFFLGGSSLQRRHT